jgi:hypothetical protein
VAFTSKIIFINPKTGDISALRGSLDDATCLKFEPSGSSLAVGTHGGELFQLSVRDGRPISADHVSQASVLCCSWSGDGAFGILDTKSGPRGFATTSTRTRSAPYDSVPTRRCLRRAATTGP